ncbi:Serine/threonine-protein kinase TOUSLED [Rhynchospora pubera]|uniref:Serine/threonine-protein kinase TOUSLED n=1 Tax=Rhynchospora pubera TaxID=906938 RepID=A0AAV8CKS3_9POAL|nr:Serine/threonine-protein kinase TOUSLED [Rhynchospora pubera]
MADDIVLQLSSKSNSNPSDPSLPAKLAKLEARMAGKSSSSSNSPSVQTGWPSSSVTAPPPPPPVKFMEQEELPESSSDDDDTGEEFLIQHNKRIKLQENETGRALQQSETVVEEKVKVLEPVDSRQNSEDLKRKKPGRGRGRSSSCRGRSKTSDQTKPGPSSLHVSSNGQMDKHYLMEQMAKVPPANNDTANFQEEVTLLRGRVASLEEELRKSRHEKDDCQRLYSQLEKELKDYKEHDQQMKTKRIKIVSDLLISVSKAERQEARMRIRQESFRLGNVGVMRAGTLISEVWEDGQAIKDLNSHLKSLLETKEAIERHRKSLRKRQSSENRGDGSDAEASTSEEDFILQDEICKSRLASIKREEENYLRERDRYELEKGRLIREMKRVRDEDGSRFNNFQILNHRYALLNLLGKGGFSEVYKAFDLVEYKYVACKLHGLNAQWSEEKKQNYIRHALRENNIHKTLVHPNIVRLWDTFEVDHNTFCTVLEYCSGKDLDATLKATPVLPEKEARIIIVQIFQGLVYLNKRSQRIIHYDLKPGNVLFDEVGVTKVTDFGLSKIVEDDVGSQGMELTSQGAGTYWYLPPECFDLSKTPLISSKVDVWSAGVMLYQMLFGKRPFGHDQTQERILREDTIINARRVEFPSKPVVSNEAKELIRKCLTYNQAERPDVLTIAQDPYLIYSKK